MESYRLIIAKALTNMLDKEAGVEQTEEPTSLATGEAVFNVKIFGFWYKILIQHNYLKK